MLRPGVASVLRRIWLISLLWLCWPLSLRAADEPVMIVGVFRDNRLDNTLLGRLREHLARNGEQILATPKMAAGEQQCTSQECLDRLAARTGAKYVLIVSAQRTAATGDSLYLTGLLYDASRHWPRQATLDCLGCKGELLVTRINELADKLFIEIRTPELTLAMNQPIVPPPGQGITAQLPERVSADGGYFDRLSSRRKLAAGVLGALSLAVFASAGAFHGLDGHQTDLSCSPAGSPHSCAWNTKWLYGTGYGLGSALLVGAGLTLFWPTETRSSATERAEGGTK